MQNSMVMFPPYFCYRPEIPFWRKFGPKTQKCQFKADIWYLDELKYAKFNCGVYIFCFPPEIPFWGIIRLKIQAF